MPALEEAIIKRVLPHSIEAEQSVIGSMMIDKDAIMVASELITGEDFYNKQYGVVFETMVELHENGKPVDLITLQDKLKEKDVPAEVAAWSLYVISSQRFRHRQISDIMLILWQKNLFLEK